MARRQNAKHLSTSVEWYTPPHVVDMARLVLGDIDLDPASSAAANERVRARRHYTSAENGLAQPWGGRVFLNPPGGKLASLFWHKAAEEMQAGRVTHLVLVAFSLDLLQRLQRSTPAITDGVVCVPRARLQYLREDGSVGPQPTHASAIVYFGDHADLFAGVFKQLGGILRGGAS